MRKCLRVPAAVLGLLFLLLSLAGGMVSADEAYTINGVSVRYRDFSSSHNECWVYASKFYYKIWGESFNSNFYGSENLLRNHSKEELVLTPEHLKEYVSQAVPGAVLRICNSGCLYGSDPMGHSLLIVSIQSDGFTTFEGGLSAAPHCREHFYTWEEFCQTSWLGGRYAYIKYIKWPSAPEKEESLLPENEELPRPVEEKPPRPSSEEPETSATLGTLEVQEPSEVPESVTYEVGDLDHSGSIEATDYVLLKRFVNGTIRLDKSQLKSGDINGDGRVDEQDLRLLRARMYADRLQPQISLSEITESLLHLLF